MKFHKIEATGPIIVQRVDTSVPPNSLPTYSNPADLGRLLYDIGAGVFYVGGNSAWEPVSSASSLLASGENALGRLRGLAQALGKSGFTNLGSRRPFAGLTPAFPGVYCDLTVANQFLLARHDIGREAPLALVNGTLLSLIQDDTSGWEFPITLSAAPGTGYRQDLVFLEVWMEEVSTTSPTFFPYGNVDYVGGSVADPVDPAVVSTIGHQTNGQYFQIRYRVRVIDGPASADWLDPAGATPFGIDNAAVEARGATGAPVSGKIFQQMNELLGDTMLFRAGTGGAGDKTGSGLETVDGFVYAIPLCGIHRRNQDIWSHTNGNGSALNTADGTQGSLAGGGGQNGRPDAQFFDVVYPQDICDFRHTVLLNGLSTIMESMSQALLSGQNVVDWGEDEFGVASGAISGNGIRGTNMLTGGGIGTNNPFGAGHQVGVWLDEGNDASLTMFPDNCRNHWSDKANLMDMVSRFTQGLPGSENPANLLTYDPSSRAVTLNTTSLSGDPYVHTTAPIMHWVDASGNISSVVLSTPWSGLGTSSAACVVDVTDHAAHSGETCVIWCQILYPAGGGFRHVTEGLPLLAEDGSTAYPLIDGDLVNLDNFTFNGVATSSTPGGAPTHVILTSGSTVAGSYVGEWLQVIGSSTGSAGELRLIIAYDHTTQEVEVDSAFSGAINPGDTLTIHPMEPGQVYLDWRPGMRGFVRMLTRDRVGPVPAGGNLEVGSFVYQTTTGTRNGSLVTGVAPSAYLGVIQSRHLDQSDIIRVWYNMLPRQEQFQLLSTATADQLYFLSEGRFIATTDGTANPGANYLTPIGQVFPQFGGVKHIIGDAGRNAALDPSLYVRGDTAVMDLKSYPFVSDIPIAGVWIDKVTALAYPKGDLLEPKSDTGSQLVHNQTIPSTVWTITHGFGTRVVTAKFYEDVMGTWTDVFPNSVENIDESVTRVTWSTPQAGRATLTGLPPITSGLVALVNLVNDAGVLKLFTGVNRSGFGEITPAQAFIAPVLGRYLVPDEQGVY